MVEEKLVGGPAALDDIGDPYSRLNHNYCVPKTLSSQLALSCACILNGAVVLPTKHSDDQPFAISNCVCDVCVAFCPLMESVRSVAGGPLLWMEIGENLSP